MPILGLGTKHGSMGHEMTRAIILIFAVSLTLAGCGSRFNPLNWFGSSQNENLVEDVDVEVFQDPRPRANTITELKIERTPGGAIVHATAVMASQGWYAPELVALNDGNPVDGVMTYDFRVVPPKQETGVGTTRSREITAGAFLSDIALQQVRVIRVNGAENSRSVRR